MKIRTLAAAFALAVAAVAGASPAAFAAVEPAPAPHLATATGTTFLFSRGDSGGNGDWATDTIERTLTVTQAGPALHGVYPFTATVSDSGYFVTDPGAFTPNQGAPFTGKRIAGEASGPLAGHASYSFTANALPDAALIPHAEGGTPTARPATTSLWYQNAFPHGTVFGGPGLGAWSWHYSATFCYPAQAWTDAAPDAGQKLADGNITGNCLPFFAGRR